MDSTTTRPSCSTSLDCSAPEHRQQHQRVHILRIGFTGPSCGKSFSLELSSRSRSKLHCPQPDSPSTSRLESVWNLPEPANRSLFGSNAPIICNSNDSSVFSSIGSFLIGGTITTHPHSLPSSRTSVKEHQQSTGGFYALLLRSDGKTPTCLDFNQPIVQIRLNCNKSSVS